MQSLLLQLNEYTITVLGVQKDNWLAMSSNLHVDKNTCTYQQRYDYEVSINPADLWFRIERSDLAL